MMKIKQMSVGDITHEDDRFREDLGDLTELIESIKDKGILQPITVTTKGRLVAGARRLAAAREAGLEEVPVVARMITSEIDLREIELLENIARKDFTWVERAKLEKKIFELKKEEDPDWSTRKQASYLDSSNGRTARRILMADVLDAVPDLEDCATEKEAWKRYKGLEEALVTNKMIEQAGRDHKEVTKWAENHYAIGDALEGMAKVNNGICHFAEVDPPYAIALDKRKSRNLQQNMDNYNEVEEDDYAQFVEQAALEVYRILADNAFCAWWFASAWYQPVRDILRQTGFKVGDVPAIWVKDTAGQTASPDTMLGSAYEPFFICRKGNPVLKQPGRGNVFNFKPVPPQAKVHPTERPVELMSEIIKTFCFPGARIIVPFLGSGVTLRAAYMNNMVGFGWDLDKFTKTRFVNAVFEDVAKRELEEANE
jgi:ParB-like chromosome segregation protein Spo0J|tara:strand:+ start:8149 stop:9429 length:1281 start_codon:yes stop_codon:yes gene_type:complete